MHNKYQLRDRGIFGVWCILSGYHSLLDVEPSSIDEFERDGTYLFDRFISGYHLCTLELTGETKTPWLP